jgi:MerR family transcriptional regulator, redox-sensitive transcriptional activator SoxR
MLCLRGRRFGCCRIRCRRSEGNCSDELEYFFHSFRRYDFKSTLSQSEFSRKSARDFRGVQRGSLVAFRVADDLAISDVARVFGLRTSAIRYYEQIGILPSPMRKNGQRRYEKSVLFRLEVVHRARESGFTLNEIRELFFGFKPATPPPKRWHKLSERKITELRIRMKQLKLMETLLKEIQGCRCNALEECGERLLSRRSKQPFRGHRN